MTRLAALILLGLGAFGASATHAGDVPDGYRLMWSDEFKKDGMPDPNKWSYDTAWNKKGPLFHLLPPGRTGHFTGVAFERTAPIAA